MQSDARSSLTDSAMQSRLADREAELRLTRKQAERLGGVLDAARIAGREEGLELEERVLAQVG